MKNEKIRAIAVSSIMGAIGFILMLLEFPLPFIIPNFIKFDFSDFPALLTSFAIGPFYGILVSLIKNILHLLVTSSAGVGELSNFMLGSVFCFFAGLIYKHKKNRKNALIGCLVGSLLMGLLSVVFNYYIVYPFYVSFFGMPMEAIIGMYKALLPSADTLIKALLIFNLPFTVCKGIIVSVICFLLYKRLSPIIKPKSK